MDKKRVYLGLIDMIMLEMIKSAELERATNIEEAKQQEQFFEKDIIEEDIQIQCEEYCSNVDDIKEACSELKHLITYWI